MRTLGWLVAVILNVGLCLLPAALIFEPDVPLVGRFVAGLTAVGISAAVSLLVLSRLHRVPEWGISAMRWLCLSYAVLWVLGSLDHGIISGQELLSVLLVSLFAWGTWKAFMLFAVRGAD